MTLSTLIRGIGFILSCIALAAAIAIDSDVVVRAPLGRTEADVVQSIRRELGIASLTKRDHTWTNSTTISRSWNGATLLQLGYDGTTSNNVSIQAGVEIVCTDCYVKGIATAELSVPSDFNVTQILRNVTQQVEGNVKNLTDAAVDWLQDFVTDEVHTVFDDDDLEYPTWNFTFQMDIPPIEETNLRFTFDGLELYMLVDTTLSLGATYTINLFNSGRDTPEALVGLYITENLQIGLIFAIDLIFTAHGEIDIRSGFHLKVDDGLAINIALFADDVSHITYNGGRFEFLPVQIESAGAVFTAVLRIGIHAGLSIDTGSSLDLPDWSIHGHHVPSVGAGIEVGVYANVAEFTTNITYQPNNAECELGVVQSYQFALGAIAGATIAFDTHTWGPVAQTSLPLFYTQLDSACAVRATPQTTSLIASPTITAAARRQAMLTAVTTTKVTYTGVNCLSIGLANCPASLQNTSLSTATSTLSTVVPVGATVSWPVSVQNAVATARAFAASAVTMPSFSGSPTSWVPPPPTSTSSLGGLVGPALQGDVHGVPKTLILGVSIGVGVPVVLALIAIIVLCSRKRSQKRRADAAAHAAAHGTPQTIMSESFYPKY